MAETVEYNLPGNYKVTVGVSSTSRSGNGLCERKGQKKMFSSSESKKKGKLGECVSAAAAACGFSRAGN